MAHRKETSILTAFFVGMLIVTTLGCLNSRVSADVRQPFFLRYDTSRKHGGDVKAYLLRYLVQQKCTTTYRDANFARTKHTFYNTYISHYTRRFFLYPDGTYLEQYYYAKDSLFGDQNWGLWTKDTTRIVIQTMENAIGKFNKPFRIKTHLFDVSAANILVSIPSEDYKQKGRECRVTLDNTTVVPIQVDSIPPPDSWLKKQKWIYEKSARFP
jgi:hypothetical protein